MRISASCPGICLGGGWGGGVNPHIWLLVCGVLGMCGPESQQCGFSGDF